MEGSETRCGRVWTGVRMEDGGERDGVWTGVDGGEDGRWREQDGVCETGGGETFRKIEAEGAADGHDSGGRWTEVVDEACFRVSLKHASLWSEIFKKIGVEGMQMGMILGERGVVVGGQRSCTKHVSGLV